MSPESRNLITVERTTVVVERTTLETPNKPAPTSSTAATIPSFVTHETITDDQLRALRNEAIASGDDGTRNIACGALNAIDEFQRFACRQACASMINAKRASEAENAPKGS